VKISPRVLIVAFLMTGCLGPVEAKGSTVLSAGTLSRASPSSLTPALADRSSAAIRSSVPTRETAMGVPETPSPSAAGPACGGPAGLEGTVQGLVSSAPSGEWGVYLHDLPRGTTVSINADQPMHPASTIKVAIAIAFLQWKEAHPEVKWTSGPVPHERSFEQLLRAMIVVSEEDATASLTEFLTQQARIDLNQEVQSWGAGQTTVVPRRSSARDLGLIIERLASGELLSPGGTDYLLGLMRTPTPSQGTRIGAGLPPGPQDLLAHKTGTTFEAGLGVVADTGLVEWQNARYVIVVLSNHVQWVDYQTALAIIAEISRVTYACFVTGGTVSPAPYGRGGVVP